MSNETAEIKELDVPDWPGWKKLQLGGTRHYISPGGVKITAYRFAQLALRYRGQSYIPEADILPGPDKTNQGFFGQILSGSKATKTNQPKPDQPSTNQESTNQEEIFVPPEPKPHAGRSGGSRASPKELSDGMYISISIATSIVALLLREPQLAATDLEAKNIAIPAANLLAKSKLNERFGRLIAESGDWQLLGYAIWMYFNRVFDVVKVKRENSGPKSNAPRTSSTNVPNTPASPNGAGATPGGFISNGAKSPPGVAATTFIRQ